MKKIANVDEIPNLGSKLVFLDEVPIAIFKINGEIHAWDNRCPHRGASLSDGYISENTIQCKYHLWEFDICLLYTSPSPRDRTRSRMPSSA